MQRICTVLVILAAVSLVGCYHATIETGLPASNDVITQKWASSFVYGLVPPSTVETAAKCPNGVARVETKLSFLNQLVGALTFGIYTPMDIMVTCASRSRAELEIDDVPLMALDDEADVGEAMAQAALESVRTRGPVFVTFGN